MPACHLLCILLMLGLHQQNHLLMLRRFTMDWTFPLMMITHSESFQLNFLLMEEKSLQEATMTQYMSMILEQISLPFESVRTTYVPCL
uniref:Secreted protein n=1 Tax=Rhizophora mucronata TaxID=61149 RepID=A0A2P2MCR0_RHIMU